MKVMELRVIFTLLCVFLTKPFLTNQVAFKKRERSIKSYADIESLFRDLNRRKIPNIFSHQADILRDYQANAQSKADVALELPTGSGKTLVGILIGEFRRINKGERVLYVCPTIQLVNQVVEHAISKYGVEAIAFTGSKHDFDQQDKNRFINSEAIAVTTYKSLFNINPFWKPNLIILDDAHAADNHIGSAWSLEINREQSSSLYQDVYEVLKPHLPDHIRFRLKQEVPDPIMERSFIEMLPHNVYYEVSNELRDLFDSLSLEESYEQYFSWQAIKNNLFACNLYFSWGQILIRPIIPPSMVNSAFSEATQRIFMSATLGNGGDLERITGVKKIHRIATPPGWEKQGLGRRFFLFPQLRLNTEQTGLFINRLLSTANKSVLIVSSDANEKGWKESILKNFPKKEVFNARDIEKSKEEFIESEDSIVILSNRYDGIDFQDDQSRLLILSYIPNFANLQERFIQSRFGASIIFNDRNKTRLIQAIGRCTRNANDYAAICIMGEKGLSDWLHYKEKRSLLHPELQAEIEFGLDQSDLETDDIVENFNHFIEQTQTWKDAEQQILEIRDEITQAKNAGEDQLTESIAYEIDYLNALWIEDYEQAFEMALKAFEKLNGGTELKGFRAFWSYLSANAAWLAWKNGGNEIFKDRAFAQYDKTLNISPSLNWFRQVLQSNPESSVEYLNELQSNIELVEYNLEQFNISKPKKYQRFIEDLRGELERKSSFEHFQQQIGYLLGFEAGNSESSGAPDPYWKSGNKFAIVFEDKIYESDDKCIPLKHIREASSHETWIRSNLSLSKDAKVITVMVTNSTCLEAGTDIHCEDLFYWNLDNFKKFAKQVISFAEKLQSRFPGIGNIAFRNYIQEEFKRREFTPEDIVSKLEPLNSLK